MFEYNKNFYPTPEHLIRKMCEKVNFNPIQYILEPSAGKGDIINYLFENHHERYDKKEFFLIEKDENLQAILKNKCECRHEMRVIDSDFLTYPGGDLFDLIIMNPPFDDGEKHLTKAIDLMYCGQIVCLLNAETIKNPYSKEKQALVRKLEELNADIQYLENEFLDAERKTNVEIALIYINIERNIEEDLTDDMKAATESNISYEDEQLHEITRKDDIHTLVAEYNRVIENGIEVIKDYFKKYKYIYKYLKLNKKPGYREEKSKWLTRDFKVQVNNFIKEVRKNYWEKALDLKIIQEKLTSEKRKEFWTNLQNHSGLEFSESNIRQFIINLSKNYFNTLEEAVVNLFEDITRKYSWSPETEKNRLHFDSWKTNDAYKVNKKFILPFNESAFFYRYHFENRGEWKLDYSICEKLRDIDKIMNYFDTKTEYISIENAINEAFSIGQSRDIESTYFKITVYKKGTIHLTFLSEDIQRRFNITACKGKNWLPREYGNKPYENMDPKEKALVNSFENKKTYSKNINKSGFELKHNQLFLE